jgi:hypothetical protein
MAFNGFLNVGILVGTILTLEWTKNNQPDINKQTQVTLATGKNDNANGDVPRVAIWDGNGRRVTQFKDKNNNKKKIGKDTVLGLSNNNDQNHGESAHPEYISVVMNGNDGIYLAAVSVASGSVQWNWTGDLGYTCGAQWYQSNFTTGSSNKAIRCVWLDANHDKGIIAKGLSLHMPDFSGDEGILAQYLEDDRRLCQNSARMTFYHDIVPDSSVPIFKPPVTWSIENGSLSSPNQGIDRKTRAYPDGTKLPSKRGLRKRKARDLAGRQASLEPVEENKFANILTVSHMEGHSAKELCDHDMSLGPDFVSMEEGLCCDMDTSRLWPLCTATHKIECFDLESKQIKSVNAKREVPRKNYKTTDEWK